MLEEITGPYRFTIRPRTADIGGGWRVRAYETMPNGEEVEVYGDIFPAAENSVGKHDPHPSEVGDAAYEQALAAARKWLRYMPQPEHRDAEHYMLGGFARDAAARLGE